MLIGLVHGVFPQSPSAVGRRIPTHQPNDSILRSSTGRVKLLEALQRGSRRKWSERNTNQRSLTRISQGIAARFFRRIKSKLVFLYPEVVFRLKSESIQSLRSKRGSSGPKSRISLECGASAC